MAKVRKRKAGNSSYSYFRTLFEQNPEWLNSKSNDLIIARYRTDHGLADDAEIEKSVKNNLANLKSVMRKKSRKGASASAGNASGGGMTGSGRGKSANRLEALEEMIDECLTLAKNNDREGL